MNITKLTFAQLLGVLSEQNYIVTSTLLVVGGASRRTTHNNLLRYKLVSIYNWIAYDNWIADDNKFVKIESFDNVRELYQKLSIYECYGCIGLYPYDGETYIGDKTLDRNDTLVDRVQSDISNFKIFLPERNSHCNEL